MHADELKWKTIEGGVKVANLIDFRLGFQNTLANMRSRRSPPRSPASDGHVHGEAYIYFISGRGYSIVGEQRVEWGRGRDVRAAGNLSPALRHIRRAGEISARIPSPLLMNLLAVMASVMPYLKPEAQKYEQPRLRCCFVLSRSFYCC